MNTRRSDARRQTIATGLALLGLLFVVGKCTTACAPLTTEEKTAVAADSVKLATCAAIAHGCKMAARDDAGFGPCWDEFDACMVSRGYFDAGPRTLAVGFDNGHPEGGL